MTEGHLFRYVGSPRRLSERELFERERAKRETRYMVWKSCNRILAEHGLEEVELDPRDDIENFLYPTAMKEVYAE